MNPTRRFMLAGVKGMILLLALALVSCAPAPATRTSTAIPQATKQQVLVAYGKLPLSFEANQGQTDPQVKFLSRGSGYTLFLTPTEAVLTLTKADVHAKRRISGEATLVEPEKRAATVLRMKLLGANPAPPVAGVGELPGKSNYFIGNDSKKWRANVPTYAKVEYRDVYPGVNLVYYGNQRQLEHDFVVSPDADPTAITLGFEGVDGMAIDALGDLVLRADGSEVRLRQPVVYQDHDGRRAVIPTRYVLKAERQVSFEVAAYDSTKPLIIDPVLAYSTFLGGSNDDRGFGIAVDAAGNAYVTGGTGSINFPTTPGAFQTTSGGGDAFVTKLDPTGAALVYSTYLGGSSCDSANGIAVDATGSAYVTGRTVSINFPTTPGAFQTTLNFTDAFVTKLNPAGSALVYSTYLGGSRSDEGHAIAVDAAGSAYVTGLTLSFNFPTTPGAFQTTTGGGGGDAFVTKLNADASALGYSTYLGGNSIDFGNGIAVDTAGNAYLTGDTTSRNFPTTPGATQPDFGGDRDAFVTKLDPTSSALVYSTYLGGSGSDQGFGIAVDTAGSAYVTGSSFSTNFPTTPGAFQTIFGGATGDAFVAKLSSATINTPVGSNVVVQPVDATSGATPVTVTFGDVTGAGNTTLTTSNAGPPPLAGFRPGSPSTYFDITTTAVSSASASVQVCINYTGITFSALSSAAGLMRLMHFLGTGFVDVTTSLNTTAAVICGLVNSLSPFAIFEPAFELFASFHARVEIEDERHEREFKVKGTFKLGANSKGIDPPNEDVILQVGTFAVTIPKGSFRHHGHGTFKFEGVAGGARLEVKIQARGGNRFEFKAEGKGAQVGTANPVTVRLAVGDDAGSTVARVKADDDD